MAIFLASSDPVSNVEGDQIAVSFKSGDETVTVALSLHQAYALHRRLQTSSFELLRDTQNRPAPACAEIIAFPLQAARRAQA